jgi:ubiquitin-like 1-activating enzyme E1 A
MAQWDERCRKLNIPYYNFVCCGLYGFYYVSLGTSFAFEREKQVIRKLVMGQSLQQSEPEYREFEEVTASSVSLREALKLDHNSVVRTRNEIYYCILSNHHPTIAVMSRVQELPELNDFDPYDESAESIAKLDKIQAIGEQIYESAVGKKPSQQTSEMLRNFARLYGVEFCPVYSILGSVASQEFIVVISRTNEPGTNWFCYDRYIHPPCLVKLATGSLSLYKICVPSRNEISQNAGN